MIRAGVAADEHRVIDMLRDFCAALGFDGSDGASGFRFPLDRGYGVRLFRFHLNRSNACCIIHDVEGTAQGVLMALATQHPFGPVIVAKENLWWIDPAYRGGTAALRMLDEYERWARSLGARFTGIAGMADDPRVATLYARRGYRVAETHYLKPVA
jgi:GNAT superfamily N-acetyltransferase